MPFSISPEVVQLPSPAIQCLADGGVPVPAHDRLLPGWSLFQVDYKRQSGVDLPG
nr:MAG TPA: hypothetical protein [Caudoviricetes sp.]